MYPITRARSMNNFKGVENLRSKKLSRWKAISERASPLKNLKFIDYICVSLDFNFFLKYNFEYVLVAINICHWKAIVTALRKIGSYGDIRK